jgi:hypothetical protein
MDQQTKAKKKNPIAKLYRDKPGTTVERLQDGCELVTRPDRTTVVRESLSRPTKRKHAIVKALIKHGCQVQSFSGGGRVVHPKYPDLINVSIAAAALKQFGVDGVRRFYQAD